MVYSGDLMESKLQEAICSGRLRGGMTFAQRVWAITARIPAGKVATYGQIARVLGGRAFRAVGMALNRNPFAPAVPCHRVVGSDGALVGFASGVRKKHQLLSQEGVQLVKGKVVLRLCQCDDALLRR
jgi:methylated-DNA-[protein]-cysteine S-methyltransferase